MGFERCKAKTVSQYGALEIHMTKSSMTTGWLAMDFKGSPSGIHIPLSNDTGMVVPRSIGSFGFVKRRTVKIEEKRSLLCLFRRKKA